MSKDLYIFALAIKEDFFLFKSSQQLGCNNTLADDQLEVMFTATDEEMRQIEQPMECLIERTKHKCKRHIRFFSNEAALKQHHCEPPINKRNASTVVKPSIALITWRST